MEISEPENRKGESSMYVLRALEAMKYGFDIGQRAGIGSPIDLCRQVLRIGWIPPSASKGFCPLSVDEQRRILDQIENHGSNSLAGGITTASLFSAINGLLNERRKIREAEEEGPELNNGETQEHQAS